MNKIIPKVLKTQSNMTINVMLRLDFELLLALSCVDDVLLFVPSVFVTVLFTVSSISDLLLLLLLLLVIVSFFFFLFKNKLNICDKYKENK